MIQDILGHLEISGRQTGKTTRLAKWASVAGITWPVTIVIGENWDTGDFRRQFKIPGGRVRIITENNLPQDEREYDDGIWCFDEFDWFARPVPVIKNGYYCTTPRFLREPAAKPDEDPLLQLIRLHGGYRCVPVQAMPWIDMAEMAMLYGPGELALFSGQVFRQGVASAA